MAAPCLLCPSMPSKPLPRPTSSGIQQRRSALPRRLPVRRPTHRGHQAKAGFPRLHLGLLFAVFASPTSSTYRVIAAAMGALRAPRPPDAPPRGPAAAVNGVGAPRSASSTGSRSDPPPPSLPRLRCAVIEVPVVAALFLVVQRRTSAGPPLHRKQPLYCVDRACRIRAGVLSGGRKWLAARGGGEGGLEGRRLPRRDEMRRAGDEMCRRDAAQFFYKKTKRFFPLK